MKSKDMIRLIRHFNKRVRSVNMLNVCSNNTTRNHELINEKDDMLTTLYVLTSSGCMTYEQYKYMKIKVGYICYSNYIVR